jgi:hypothetical protein
MNNFALEEQEYACLYCQYDSEQGNRNWKSLLDENRDAAIKIDIEVAISALKDGRSDVNLIIFHGSPLAQRLEEFPAHRETYVRGILASARSRT